MRRIQYNKPVRDRIPGSGRLRTTCPPRETNLSAIAKGADTVRGIGPSLCFIVRFRAGKPTHCA